MIAYYFTVKASLPYVIFESAPVFTAISHFDNKPDFDIDCPTIMQNILILMDCIGLRTSQEKVMNRSG